MKVIITGISGFVGQNLNNFLKTKRFDIQGLSLRDSSWKSHLNRHADVLIHLAGKAHDTANNSIDETYFRINRDLTIDLFEEFLASDIRDFFFFSSVKSVADTVEGILDEDIVPNPLTPYGQSKQQAERYLLSKSLSIGKRLFIIRPCMIHGPGNKGNLNLLYKVVERGIPYPLGAFKNERSFLSISNLTIIIESLISDPSVSGGVYNIADDEPLSTNGVIEVISKTLNQATRVWRINKKIISSIASIGDILHLPLNSERLKKLTESYVVSNEKIKQVLKIDKLPVSSVQGLVTTIKSFQQSK